jgi:hypothetical protein
MPTPQTRRSTDSAALGRRALLAGAAAAAAGAVARPAAAAVTRRKPKPAPRRLPTRLDGRDWHVDVFRAGTSRAAVPLTTPTPIRGDTIVMWGRLVDRRGHRAGEFYSSAQCVYAPLSKAPAASFEQHAFHLPDGIIFGMGTVPAHPKGPVTYAVVGGTGDYAGVRGTYTAVLRPVEFGGNGKAQFVLHVERPA